MSELNFMDLGICSTWLLMVLAFAITTVITVILALRGAVAKVRGPGRPNSQSSCERCEDKVACVTSLLNQLDAVSPEDVKEAVLYEALLRDWHRDEVIRDIANTASCIRLKRGLKEKTYE